MRAPARLLALLALLGAAGASTLASSADAPYDLDSAPADLCAFPALAAQAVGPVSLDPAAARVALTVGADGFSSAQPRTFASDADYAEATGGNWTWAAAASADAWAFARADALLVVPDSGVAATLTLPGSEQLLALAAGDELVAVAVLDNGGGDQAFVRVYDLSLSLAASATLPAGNVSLAVSGGVVAAGQPGAGAVLLLDAASGAETWLAGLAEDEFGAAVALAWPLVAVGAPGAAAEYAGETLAGAGAVAVYNGSEPLCVLGGRAAGERLGALVAATDELVAAAASSAARLLSPADCAPLLDATGFGDAADAAVTSLAVGDELLLFGAAGAANADGMGAGRVCSLAYCAAQRARGAAAGARFFGEVACADCEAALFSTGGAADACVACSEYAAAAGLALPADAHWVDGEAECAWGCDDWFALDAEGAGCDPPAAPGAPGGVACEGLAGGRLAASWAAPAVAADAAPVVGFELEVRDAAGALVHAEALGLANASTVVGLLARANYSVSVAAANVGGAGAAATASCTTLNATAPGAPPGAPELLAARGSALSVTWAAVDDSGGAPVSGYDVLLDGAAVAQSSSAAARSAELGGLVADTAYVVSVRAVNAAGAGAESAAAALSTSGPTPAAPPASVAAVNSSCCSLTLAVELPADTGGAPATGVEVGSSSFAVSADGRYEVTGLLALTEYSLAARAVTAAGGGNWSAAVTASTAAPEPPSAAQNLVVANATATFVEVQWDAPASAGGLAVNYSVALEGAGVVEASTPALAATVGGLTRKSTYTVTVTAFNAAGAAPGAATLANTTAAPPGAPAGLAAAEVNPTALALNWSAPADDGGAAIAAYHVGARAAGSDAAFDTLASVAGAATNATLAGLTPGAAYEVAARAVTAVSLGPWGAALAVNMTPPLPCPNDCSGHGTCHAYLGTCLCDAEPLPYGGANCSQYDGATTQLTLQGSVDDFDEAALLAALADALAVDAARLFVLDARNGSVIVDLLVADAATAGAVVAALEGLAAASDVALQQLGVLAVDAVAVDAVDCAAADGDCGGCLSLSASCGFCSDSAECLPGGADGAAPGFACEVWTHADAEGALAECPDCAAETDCEACAALGARGCDWCEEAQLCASEFDDGHAAACGEWAEGECLPPCDEVDDCEECGERAACSWCGMSETEPGACQAEACDDDSVQCDVYQPPAERCPAHLLCADCIADADCAYCSASSACREATTSASCSTGWNGDECLDYCGGSVALYDDRGWVQLGSPALNTTYAPDQTCVWNLFPVGGSGQYSLTHVYFTYVDVEPGDVIEVSDGTGRLAEISGASAFPSPLYTSSAGGLTVTFTADAGCEGGATPCPFSGFEFYYTGARFDDGATFVFVVLICTCMLLLLAGTLYLCARCCKTAEGPHDFAAGGGGGIEMAAAPRHTPADVLAQLPALRFEPGDPTISDSTCSICLCEYEPADDLRRMPCQHVFHDPCIVDWLRISRLCPLCKQDVSGPPVAGASAPEESVSPSAVRVSPASSTRSSSSGSGSGSGRRRSSSSPGAVVPLNLGAP